MKKKTLLIFMIVLVLLQVYTLFIPPVSGVAGDGTLFHVLNENGLYRTNGDANFNMVYGVSGEGSAVDTTPIRLVKTLSGIFSTQLFFVPILAAIYMILFDIGVYLAFSKMKFFTPWLHLVMMGAVLLIFCDVGYLGYFNSMTYEGAVISYLSLLIGSAIYLARSEKPKGWNLVLVALAAFLLAGTTKHMFFLVFPAAILLVRFAWVRKELWWRALGIVLAVAILIGNGMIFSKSHVPNESSSRFNSVYYGVMKDADEEEAAQIVDWFSLPKETAKWAGKDYYNAELTATEQEKMEVSAKISYSDVANYYFTHPSALGTLAKGTVSNSFFVQPEDDRSYSEWNDVEKPTLGIWNILKKALPINSIWMMGILWIALWIAAIRFRKGAPMLYDIGMWLLLSGMVSFFLPVIFFGYAQISKTAFPFAILLDMVILFLLAWGIETLMLRQNKIKEKYGVTQ